MKETNKNIGYLFVVLSAICFATGGILIKINTWSSMSISGSRSILALILMAAFMRYRGNKFKVNKSTILGAFANTGMMTTFVMANKMTSAANAIVLQFTMPVYIIFLLWIFWKKRPDCKSIVTVIVSFIGILFFFFDGMTTQGMIGNILALVSGLLYAIVFLLKKIPDCDFDSAALISFGINFVIGLPWLLRETEITPVNIMSVVLLGIVQLGMAYIFLGLGLDKVPPVGAAFLSMIEPILNPIIVAVLYGEVIGKLSIFGAALVLLASIIYNVIGSRTSAD